MLELKSKYPRIKYSKQTIPPNFDDVRYICDFRTLIDKLDHLGEQLSLRHQTTLFDLMSHSPSIDYMLFLAAPHFGRVKKRFKGNLKTPLYPHLVTTILANGNMFVREYFIENPHLIEQLLLFLNGEIPLHSFAESPAVESKYEYNTRMPISYSTKEER